MATSACGWRRGSAVCASAAGVAMSAWQWGGIVEDQQVARCGYECVSGACAAKRAGRWRGAAEDLQALDCGIMKS